MSSAKPCTTSTDRAYRFYSLEGKVRNFGIRLRRKRKREGKHTVYSIKNCCFHAHPSDTPVPEADLVNGDFQNFYIGSNGIVVNVVQGCTLRILLFTIEIGVFK